MWFCAVRSADLAAPGAFRKVQVGRESVLIVRGRDGALNAFLNICRHRGATLCTEESGQVKRHLRCPYHAWTYGLDGKLVAAPNLGALTDETGARIDRTEYGLVPVALREWLGYAWVCLAADAPSFEAEVIGAVTGRLGDAEAIEHYRIEELSVGRRVVYDVAANWKLIVENFMECYHCATIHPELTEVLPEFADGLAAQYYVGHGAEFGSEVEGFTVDGSAGFDTIPGVTAEQDRRYYAVTVRPTVFINLVPDHVIFHRMYPMSADRTVVECDWLYLPDVVEQGRDVERSVELFHRVNQQDFEACERTQPAMSSRAYRNGGVLVPSEHHIAEFHEWIVTKLDRRSGPDPESEQPMSTEREASLFIDGQWVHASDGGTRDIVNPADGSVVAVVDEAGHADAARRRRCGAGRLRRRVHGRARRSPSARRCWTAIADLLVRDRDQIARVETLDTGKTLEESCIDIDDVVSVFRYYARLAAVESDRLVDVGDPAVISRVVREPIGVCVLIAPWNYPLLQISWKIAPALAAGCTMVAKPSEVTPLSTIALRPAGSRRRGFRPAVVNLVQASGAAVGAALTDTPDVDLISFTGGAPTGVAIARAAAPHVTRVALELGGKNPHIVFADAEWKSAVDAVVTGVFLHSGQVCSSGTRLIVEESIADEFVAELVVRAGEIRFGDGLDPAQSDRAAGVDGSTAPRSKAYVELGDLRRAPSWSPVARGPPSPEFAAGSYYLPTIFDHCDRSMRIVQEETFGPILTVERFTTEQQAIELGNDTYYGLAAGVRTADTGARRARRARAAARHGVAQRLRLSTPRPRSGAVSASPATAASSGPPGWPNTKSSNISGTTPHRRRWTGSATDRRLRSASFATRRVHRYDNEHFTVR